MQLPLIVIAGPTGVGKTELSLRLAEHLGGQILSADSRQLYRRLDIGTAKPTTAQRERVPHHLVDVLEPEQRYSAGTFSREARRIMGQIHQMGTPALLVGGSGMYLDATIDGLGASPPVDGELRRHLASRWSQEGGAALHHELVRQQPATASRLDVNDRSRILRALELLELTGDATLATSSQTALRPRPLLITLTRPRQQLYARIGARVEEMLAHGWREEVETLLASGVPEDSAGMESLGYQQLVAHIRGHGSVDEAISNICRRTRLYAKRQLTWLRRDRRYRWLDMSRLGQRGCMSRILDQWYAGGTPSAR
ncbi:MAG: tRNA (adenosine(37)-N6)-dimethylallyltransferase MiaA [Gemmatimonadetes bacterium]|nr:tRNA (adenosine(37)-N6)-dimethylallyltransferase MiaA [Gemmatimonadota bacterium]